MKRMICSCAFLMLAATVPAFAAEDAPKDAGTAQLLAQRREVELQMYKMRVETIKTDPEIRRLHEKIMAMHKELQLKIDSSPAMQKLIRKAEQLDRQIGKTEKK